MLTIRQSYELGRRATSADVPSGAQREAFLKGIEDSVGPGLVPNPASPAGDGAPRRALAMRKVIARLERPAGPARPKVVTDPGAVVRILSEYIGDRLAEVFVVLYVDARNQVVGFDEFTSGDLTSVAVSVQGIMRSALLVGAPALITAHQHPSGYPQPSDDDRALWREIRNAARVLQLVVLDNMVVTADTGRHFSEADTL